MEELERRENIVSIEECPKCGLKNKRKFQQGDYVLKQSGKCPKCNISMYIKLIYAESFKP